MQSVDLLLVSLQHPTSHFSYNAWRCLQHTIMVLLMIVSALAAAVFEAFS